MDIPIVMHPNFNSSTAMVKGVNWQLAGTPRTFTGFPYFNVDGSGVNPYTGITDFPGITGVWKKVTYYPLISGSTITQALPQVTGNLWKLDKPDVGQGQTPDYYTGNPLKLPDLDNNGGGLYPLPDPANYSTWIKSIESFESAYRGASPVWVLTEAWWANVSRGWRNDIYSYY